MNLPESVEQPLTEQVRDIALSGVVTLPPFPEIALEVQRLLNNEDGPNAQRVADAIRSEPALTAALLRMANSTFFGGLAQVTDLNQAVARLGLRRVGSLVTTVVTRGQFRTKNHNHERLVEGLWNHAVATALAARKLTGITGGDAEESYLAGLLHDVGKLLALKSMDQLLAYRDNLEITETISAEILDATHAELGEQVLVEWRFPESICRAVSRHHADPASLEDGLPLRLQAADAIAIKLGAHPNPPEEFVLEDCVAVERLELTEVELASILVDLEDELEDLKRHM